MHNVNWYGYDAVGNIGYIQDSSLSETQYFGYDSLDRLTSATASSGLAPYTQTFTHNAIGNILTKNSSISYTYDTNHKHAVSAISAGGSYSYDANGNMTCRVEGGITYKQDYDVENRLTVVSVMSGGCNGTATSTTNFIYDGDGNLVKKINPDGSRTLYVAGIYELDKNSSGSVTGTKTYYPAAGAMRVNNTLYFILPDHLGSASTVLDASGNIVGKQRYYPFGEARYTAGTMFTDKLFTGQRQMPGLGIYYYNARFYSPYQNH